MFNNVIREAFTQRDCQKNALQILCLEFRDETIPKLLISFIKAIVQLRLLEAAR